MFEASDYEQVSRRMGPDDLVIWFTDGLSECVDAEGEMIGPEGLATLLNGIRGLPVGEVVPELVRRVGEMSAANLSEDDVTVLLFRPNGERTSLRDNLLAPFRAAADVLSR
jgi:sigma-B regulation protein RsbU (phosphoserine phosphatase)